MTKVEMQSALDMVGPNSTVPVGVWRNGGGRLIQLHF
jgi:hypothetical protein